MKQQDSKTAYQRWHVKSETLVDNEVDLHLLSNKIRLRYIPIPGRASKYDDGTERGAYEAMVIRFDGKVKKIKVANDWVEDNFSADALAVVQRVAHESKIVYKDKNSSKTEKGYISLAGEGDLQLVDNRQISQIRYLPHKLARRPNGEMKLLLPAWKGLIQTEKTGECEFVMLSKEWVDNNIDPDFQQLLKDMRNKDKMEYVPIPEGANEGHHVGAVKFLENAPISHFFNRKLLENARRCVVDSAASGLYHLGQQRLAYIMYSSQGDKNKELTGLDFFRDVVRIKATKQERKQIQVRKIKNKKFNVLTDSQQYLLCLVGIHSSDGKTDHAICIVGKWIFDSNFEKALPLNEDSLNICSSSKERHSTYVGITRGYLLQSFS